MIDMPVQKRVSQLEKLMAQLIRTVDRVDQQQERTERESQRTQRSLEQLSREMLEFKNEMHIEMRAFKNEMCEFKNEMRTEMGAFKDEMRAFKNEMGDFKDEMREFKNEMSDFKDEMLDFKTESRKHWGELANKMGTMAEDLVAPSIERIFRETVGCDRESIEYVAVRVKRRHSETNQQREFDVVAVGGEYLLVNETKSLLNPESMTAFARDLLPQVRSYFPEFAAKKVIGAVASLYVDDSLVRCGERLGLIVLGFGEDVMEVLNDPDFTPTFF